MTTYGSPTRPESYRPRHRTTAIHHRRGLVLVAGIAAVELGGTATFWATR